MKDKSNKAYYTVKHLCESASGEADSRMSHFFFSTVSFFYTAKLSSNSANPQLPPGSFRCGKNCATCPYISNGLTTYAFFSTGEPDAPHKI